MSDIILVFRIVIWLDMLSWKKLQSQTVKVQFKMAIATSQIKNYHEKLLHQGLWLDKKNSSFISAFKSLNLLQSVTSTVNQVCRKLKIDEKTFKSVKSGRVIPCSVHAVKNGRRKMEDRHVLIHDLNAIYCDNQVSINLWILLNIN